MWKKKNNEQFVWVTQNRSSVSRYAERVGFPGMEFRCSVWKLPLYADQTALFVSVNTAEL